MINKRTIALKMKGLFNRLGLTYEAPLLKGDCDIESVSSLLYSKLSSTEPCFIGRFGTSELNVVTNYIGIVSGEHSIVKFALGKQFMWWWDEYALSIIKNNAGFFSSTPAYAERFSKMILEDSFLLDILICLTSLDSYITPYMNSHVKFVDWWCAEPYWSRQPWTQALKDKKILVVHPLAETIKDQYYNHRSEIFSNPSILPEFKSLEVIPAVQSIGGENCGFKDWFEALEWMKAKIEETDFEICLLGCGAYGFPLGAHIKRLGKKSIYMGGALQMLFGIKGARWMEEKYSHNGIEYNYIQFMNEFWRSPDLKDIPAASQSIENGCYW